MIRPVLTAARALALAAIALGFPIPASDAASSKATTHTIVMEGTTFNPASLTVKPGDHVVWVNKDSFPHTASAGRGSFDSGNIAAGKKWRYTAKKAGEFPYVCKLHPTMKGTLVVR